MSGIVRANNAGQSGIASNVETIDSDDYVDDSIDTAHIAANQVTLAEMAGITRGSIIIGDSSGDPAALAKGTETYVLTAGADDTSWAAASSGAVTREGGNLTEASTTSTSAADLLSATSLTIAGAQPAKLIINGRKASGAAATGGYGLKLNTTTVIEAAHTSNGVGGFTGANEAQEVSIVGELRPRVTDYTIGKYVGAMGAYVTSSGGALGTGFAPGGGHTAAYPTVEITAVVVRGITASASQTVSSDELNVYSFVTS